jgi:Tfp pilus assembly PilM family ATPase
VRTSFDYYESQAASSVEKIFLSGAGSRLYNLKDYLTRSLGIEADYWSPMQRIAFLPGADAEKIKVSAAQFAVALGLALRK